MVRARTRLMSMLHRVWRRGAYVVSPETSVASLEGLPRWRAPRSVTRVPENRQRVDDLHPHASPRSRSSQRDAEPTPAGSHNNESLGMLPSLCTRDVAAAGSCRTTRAAPLSAHRTERTRCVDCGQHHAHTRASNSSLQCPSVLQCQPVSRGRTVCPWHARTCVCLASTSPPPRPHHTLSR